MGAWVRTLGVFALVLGTNGVVFSDQLADEEPADQQNPPVPRIQEPVIPAPPEKNRVTKYGNISVIGNEQQVRGSVASLAMDLKDKLNQLINEKGRKLKIPFIIELHGKRGDQVPKRTVASEIRQIQGQYQLLIHVHLARGIEREKLRYHLMEMLLYERGLANGQKVEEGERLIVKPWLVVGLLEVLDLRAGKSDRSIYQAKIAYFSIVPLQQVFDASERAWRAMDGRKPAAFRAISGAMVSALIRQPKGRPSMAGYLNDFATFKGESENLMRKHFPSMNQSNNSLEKWVSLEMLELRTSRNTEVFSILETEKRLDSILKLRYRDKEKAAKEVGIDGYEEVLAIESISERAQAVATASAELQRLSYRCFPTYRPILLEYGMILRDIVSAKKKGVKTIPARLESLNDTRMKNRDAATRVRDYLDWFYITQTDEVGASFEQYREFSDALEKESNRVHESDSSEKYLDTIQRIYGSSGK